MTVFIEFLEWAIIKGVTSKPNVMSMLVPTPVSNVLSPMLTFDIVSPNVMTRYVSKQVVINPPQKKANSICVYFAVGSSQMGGAKAQ